MFPLIHGLSKRNVSFWTRRQQITISASAVDQDLPDFPLLITDANLSGDLWNHVKADGSDIAVTNTEGDRLERHVLSIDRERQKLAMLIRVPVISSSLDTSIYLYFGNEEAIEENSSNIFPNDYLLALHMFGPGFRDISPIPKPLEARRLGTNWGGISFFKEVDRSPSTGCHQGVITDGAGTFWTTDNNLIKKYDDSWNLLQENTDPNSSVSGETNHVGDGDYYDGKLYLPVERWVSCGDYSDQHIAIFDAETLSFLSEMDISEHGHEISSIVVEPDRGIITVTSYCQGGQIFHYDINSLEYMGVTPLSETLTGIQGITRLGDYYYMSTDISGGEDTLYQVTLDGSVVGPVYYSELNTSDGNDNMEGTCTDGVNIYLLVDNGSNDQKVRKLEFTDAGYFLGYPKAQNKGNFLVADLGEDATDYSMTVSFYRDIDEQRELLAVSEDQSPGSGNANKTSVAIDDGLDLGSWESDGSGWSYTGYAPPMDEFTTTHVTRETGAQRCTYYNGANGSCISISASPPSGRDKVFIGASPDSNNPVILGGAINVARVRTNKVGAAWVKYEDMNCRQNQSSYSADPVETGGWPL